MKPRVLMVGRTRYRLPLNESLARKFGALGERLDLRVLAAAPRGASAGDGTFALQRGTPVAALDAPAFYGSLPVRIARELRRERLVGALREDRVCGLASELPGDADRQRAVERRGVERGDRCAPLQREGSVAPGGAARSRRPSNASGRTSISATRWPGRRRPRWRHSPSRVSSGGSCRRS